VIFAELCLLTKGGGVRLQLKKAVCSREASAKWVAADH